jgi:hypothetical protein
MTLLSTTINGLNHEIPVYTPYHSNSKSGKNDENLPNLFTEKKKGISFTSATEVKKHKTNLVSQDDQISGCGFYGQWKTQPLKVEV